MGEGEITIGSAFGAVALHGHVRVEVIESAVGFFAAIPAALVHAFNFLEAAARTLVLSGTGDGDERVDLGQGVVSGRISGAFTILLLCRHRTRRRDHTESTSHCGWRG